MGSPGHALFFYFWGGGAARGRPTPVVVAALQARQELSPAQLQADYEFDLHLPHDGVRELLCEYDPVLRPYEVNIRDLEAWDDRTDPNGGPGLLTVRLREPVGDGSRRTLLVRCLATLPRDRPWTSPALRLAQALPRGETLVLRVHPDLHLDDWQPGGFRLEGITSGEAPGRDRRETWQVLTLTAGLEAGPSPARPGARIRWLGPAYSVRQLTWWQARVERESLTALITAEVSQGRLHQLSFQLPDGWDVERVETSPADLLRGWALARENGRPLLVTDLHRPLGAGSAAQWLVGLKPASPQRLGRSTPQPFPDLLPLAAQLREGGLAISVDPLCQADVTTVAPPGPLDSSLTRWRGSGVSRGSLPWIDHDADWFFPFRGTAVTGTLRLRSRPVSLRAQSTTRIVATHQQLAVSTRLTIQPEAGTPSAIDCLSSAVVPPDWRWATVRGGNPVRGVQRIAALEWTPRLLVLGAATPWSALASAACTPPPGFWYRVSLTRPLSERLELELTGDVAGLGPLPRAASCLAGLVGPQPLEALGGVALAEAFRRRLTHEKSWPIPLLVVPSADVTDGEVVLWHDDSLGVARQEGLREVPYVPRATAHHATGAELPHARSFRYSSLPLALTLQGQMPRSDHRARPRVDRATLTVYVEPGGDLRHHLRFRIVNWPERQFPLTFPPQIRLLAARVDGRWVDRFSPGAPESAADAAATVVLGLPLPKVATSGSNEVEVVYTLSRPQGWLWSVVDAVVPRWPAPVLDMRRTWRLPPGWTPLTDSAVRRLPGPGDESRERDAEGHLSAALLRAWPTTESWAVRQRDLLLEAAAEFRRGHQGADPTADPATLGEALDRLAFDLLPGRLTVVVDVQALREVGISPSTPLPPEGRPASGGPFWEGLGVVYVPCRPGPLLTSRRQALAWLGPRRPIDSLPPSVEEAVAEALASGHDSSGRFCTVTHWLQGAASVSAAEFDPSRGDPGFAPLSGLIPSSLADGWSEWAPFAGDPTPERLVIVHSERVTILGAVLAVALVVMVGQAYRRSGRWPQGWILATLLAGAILGAWLPSSLRGPAVGLSLVALCLALLGLMSRMWVVPPRTQTSGASAETAAAGSSAPRRLTVLALVLGGLWAGTAGWAEDQPATVYIVPGPSGRAADQSVLVPPALWAQLEAAAARRPWPSEGVVFTDAHYEGRVGDGVAEIEATLGVYAFGMGPALVTVPLSGVQLREALVDGVPAHATTPRAATEGYALRIAGRGRHVILLRFSVAVTSVDDDRELRFGIPELFSSRLTLRLPAAARVPTVVGARGASRSGQSAEPEPKASLLESDLGRLASVQVRWRSDGASPGSGAPLVRTEEAFLWELTAASARLLAVVDYTVVRGTVTGFDLNLPAGLEVRNVEAGPAGPATPPKLKEWAVTESPAGRRCHFEFQGPVRGTVRLTLELLPRAPLGPAPLLPFPTAVGTPGTGFLAYRAEGVEASVVEGRALRAIDAEALAETFAQAFARRWESARQERLSPATKAFWRTPGGSPFLRLQLRQRPSSARADVDITWLVGRRRADWSANMRLRDPEGILGLVEWQLPADVTLAQVTGPDIRSWSRRGNRVQIWLRHSIRETTLQLAGWRPLAPPAEQTPAVFDLPPTRVLTPTAEPMLVQLAGVDGQTLTAQRLQNLRPAPDRMLPGVDLAYLSEAGPATGTFRVSPLPPGPPPKLLTFVEVRGPHLSFVSTFVGSARTFDHRAVTVTLRRWEGDDVRFEATGLSQPAEAREGQRQGLTVRTWTFEVPPRSATPSRWTLSGTVPAAGLSEVPMPDIRVSSGGRPLPGLEHYVAIAGPELSVGRWSGLTSLVDPAVALQELWPGEAARLRRAGGAAWRVTSDDWRLQLRLHERTGDRAPLDLVLAEHAARLPDGQRWLHQATFWLYHGGAGEVRCRLPEGARLQTAVLDDRDVSPPPSATTFAIALPGTSGIRRLDVVWHYANGDEPFDRPRLETPQLDGLEETPLLWTLHVPAGFQVRGGSAGAPLRASAAGLELRRAAAFLHLADILAPRLRSGSDPTAGNLMLALERRCRRLCRQAEQLLPNAVPDAGPQGQALAVWLRELREQIDRMAQRYDLESLRRDGGQASVDHHRSPAADGLPEQGTPAFWQGKTTDLPPRPVLLPLHAGGRAAAVGRTVLIVLLIVGLATLALATGARTWPEQVALLGLVGVVLVGLEWHGVFLLPVVLALVIRGGQVAWWLASGWVRRPAAAAPADTASAATRGPKPA
ncbi:MAG: hypothetical protein NZ700_01135 [Gemmataceae bacterium]|nr:hypothetical protein [Gemmataceae bacterium]MDW8264264.1 hypothetical protein [Gemmataceae bacterium]